MIGFFSPSMPEMMMVGLIALLLFGKRLPEVARSVGKGVREFKEGIAGVQNEFTGGGYTPPRRDARPASRPEPTDEDDRGEFTAPKFEPPPSLPAEPTQTA